MHSLSLSFNENRDRNFPLCFLFWKAKGGQILPLQDNHLPSFFRPSTESSILLQMLTFLFLSSILFVGFVKKKGRGRDQSFLGSPFGRFYDLPDTLLGLGPDYIQEDARSRKIKKNNNMGWGFLWIIKKNMSTHHRNMLISHPFI